MDTDRCSHTNHIEMGVVSQLTTAVVCDCRVAKCTQVKVLEQQEERRSPLQWFRSARCPRHMETPIVVRLDLVVNNDT